MSVRLRAAEVAKEVGFSEDFINTVIFSADCWNECIRKAWEIDPEKTKKGLAILADDEDGAIRQAVSRSKYTPAEILEKLANDRNNFVRSGVAHNLKTPSHILNQLAKKGNVYMVYTALLYNPNTPLAALEELANNPDPQISQLAQNRLGKFRLNSSLY